MIFFDASGITRSFGRKIIFLASLPVLVVFLDPGSRRGQASVMVPPVMALARVPGHHVGGGRHHPRPRVAAHPAVAATQVSLVSFTVRTQTRSENKDIYAAAPININYDIYLVSMSLSPVSWVTQYSWLLV